MSRDQLDELTAAVWQPPPGDDPDNVPAGSPWSAEEEMRAFRAAFGGGA